MRFLPTDLLGMIVVEPDVHRDERGFFFEVYHAAKYADAGIRATFVQDNHSCSRRGTLRGLHGQGRRPQGKLVRALRGEIFDVGVDARRGSPTFGRWVGVTLSAEDRRLLYVPAGFLHGFCVISEAAEVEYKCTELYDAADEIAVRWNDPDVGIDWPVRDPILSPKDAAAPRLSEVAGRLPLDAGD